VTGALRHIAVTVEEPEIGQFKWGLLEQGTEWAAFRRSKRPAASYAKAMAAGLLALQEMVDDLDAGPREEAMQARPLRPRFGFGFGGLK
jgi:hypothetical protein